MNPPHFLLARNLRSIHAGLLLLLTAASALAQPAESKYFFSHLAGPLGGWGSLDGTGSSARFYGPIGVAADRSGNVYVADRLNHTIRKITADGTVTTLAGKAGLGGDADGSNADARFSYPSDVALDATGNLFVAETGKAGIRKITPAGSVVSLANDLLGEYVTGNHVTTDSAGNLYVADYNACIISKVTPAGVVTTLAGTRFSPGNVDGTGAAARFDSPQGLAVDGSGNVIVADRYTLRKISTAGVVTTLAGLAGTPGSADGSMTDARFDRPAGVALDSAGNVYVADTFNHTIRKISATGTVTTLAGTAGVAGNTDGQGTAARFDHPIAVTTDPAGNVYVADLSNHAIRKINPSGFVTTLAGLPGGYGSADGTGVAARFSGPNNVAVDAVGNVYVADVNNNTIRKITPSGDVAAFVGTTGVAGSTDGTGASAQFAGPAGVTVDSMGNIYVADTGNHTIRKVTPAGAVTTLAGAPGQKGSTDGTGAAARFFFPRGLVVDGGGNVYVADTFNDTIRKISASGAVTTLAGQAGQGGWRDGTGAYAAFDLPCAIALDATGTLYVTDSNSRTIRKVTAAGAVTTLAGDIFRAGSADGIGVAAQFHDPSGVAVDAAGNLFIADAGNHLIRRVAPDGTVTTIGGSAGVISSADGIGSAALFNYPTGIAVDGAANLYIADRDNNAIRKGQLAGPPVITTQPAGKTVAPGDTVQFSVAASSVLPLTYQWYFNDTSFSGATTNTLSFTNARSSDAGNYTVVVTNQLGSTISNKAALAVATAPVTPPSAPAASGGGGSMEGWFSLTLLALAAARRRASKQRQGAPPG